MVLFLLLQYCIFFHKKRIFLFVKVYATIFQIDLVSLYTIEHTIMNEFNKLNFAASNEYFYNSANQNNNY